MESDGTNNWPSSALTVIITQLNVKKKIDLIIGLYCACDDLSPHSNKQIKIYIHTNIYIVKVNMAAHDAAAIAEAQMGCIWNQQIVI